ncbi:MAG: hypothetical protein AAFR34_01810 [Pseudomonadota bacterium]
MGEFIAILSIYYMCDATAAVRPLAGGELAACTQTYESVKVYFIEDWELAPKGSLARFEQNAQGYAGFKAWEAENAELVSRLRREAEAKVVRGVRPV